MDDLLSYTSLNKKRINKICSEVNGLESTYSSYSDAELTAMTNKFRQQLRSGKTIDDIMPHALAVCREAIKRKLGMRPYDTQIIAAASMSNNIIAEMKTGEGKTLVQILSSYLYALEATKDTNRNNWGSVHILTANEYLAQRDRNQNASVFNLLGLSCGYAEEKSKSTSPEYRVRKTRAYRSDILYATAKTVAFDYLDDNQVKDPTKKFIGKEMFHAIVDEADDVLLDQATSPLVLSGSMPGMDLNNSINTIRWACSFVNGTNGVRKKPITCRICEHYSEGKSEAYSEDCTIFKDTMTVVLSERLYREIYGKDYFTDIADQEARFFLDTCISNAILAKFFFQRDKQYALVDNGLGRDAHGNIKPLKEVMLISDTTGRLMPKTRYRNGLHEAIEAQEEHEAAGNYFIKFANKHIERGRITYPAFANLYKTGISGMTGTSAVEEFRKLYGLETFIVDPLKPSKRVDRETELYATKDLKYKAIVKEVLKAHAKHQPILIGTTSIRESNELCEKYLKPAGLRFQRLDAINDSDEAEKIKIAGHKDMITVATNMAGRGTDIKLEDGVEELGGLYVIGTSKNNSKRIDRQLMGRCARQGQKGVTKYFQSLEDELITGRYGKYKLQAFIKRYSKTGEKIEDRRIKKIVDDCQLKQEGIAERSRRIEYEVERRVFSVHREKFYEQRNKILNAKPKEIIAIVGKIIQQYAIKLVDNPDELYKIDHLIFVEDCYDKDNTKYKNNIIQTLLYRFQLSKGMVEPLRYIEYVRSRILDVLDTYWISHLINLEELKKTTINIASVGKDSLEVFEEEANRMFIGMNDYVQNEIITYATTPDLKFGTYEVKEINDREDLRDYEVTR